MSILSNFQIPQFHCRDLLPQCAEQTHELRDDGFRD